MKLNRYFMAVLASVLCLVSCQEKENTGAGPSDKSFFSMETLNYNLSQNPVISIPVVRLGTSGDLQVSISASGSSLFNVPTSAVIKEGNRIANLEVTYDKANLTFNDTYELDVTIADFSSIYGYKTVKVVIEYPTSYYEFGSGTIVEDWWGEQEDKVMYAREFGANLLQCYLPDCWGHDSGPGYDVKDYIFYWNTETNKIYVPLQLMGTEDWSIADRGAIACQFGGPNHKAGSADWMSFIDAWYASSGFTQPHYDPATKRFYLSDTAAVSPETGNVVYGDPGKFDIFTLE